MLNLTIVSIAFIAFALGMLAFAISLWKEVKRHEKNKSR